MSNALFLIRSRWARFVACLSLWEDRLSRDLRFAGDSPCPDDATGLPGRDDRGPTAPISETDGV